jgi:DNA polymerase-3 subunit epsilon
MRQVVLDTETTGLEPEQGHRVIEIGAVEVIDRKFTRRHFHEYINPEREIDDAAIEVHGITLDELSDKPKFGDIAERFLDFIRGAELIIHNAAFDLAFLDYELSLLPGGPATMSDICPIVDSLQIARHKHPGQKNSLDALCRRYHVNNAERTLHGALLDAEILADVYLAMTGGQTALLLGEQEAAVAGPPETTLRRLATDRRRLVVLRASGDDLTLHEGRLDAIERVSERVPVWRLEGETIAD